ncbi:tyrS [Acrasis kona]|uniref:TyrS n=1 Tax=Acrasis kona TaxID=1008807 RepID=A0AAW2Z9A1_9EUKA
MWYIKEESLEDLTLLGLAREQALIEESLHNISNSHHCHNQASLFEPLDFQVGYLPEISLDDFIFDNQPLFEVYDTTIPSVNEEFFITKQQQTTSKKRKRELIFKGKTKRNKNIDSKPEDHMSFKFDFR